MRLKRKAKTEAVYTLKIIHTLIFTYLDYQNYVRHQRNFQNYV